MGEALVLGPIGWTDPFLRERQAVGTTSLPGARRWDADQVHPQAEVADEAGSELAELLDRPRSVGQRGS